MLCRPWLWMFALVLWMGCDAVAPVAQEEPTRVTLIAPARAMPGERIPVVARAHHADGTLNPHVTASVALCTEGTCTGDPLSLKKGRGAGWAQADSTGSFTLSLDGAEGQRQVAMMDSVPVMQYAGILSTDQTWDASADRHITGALQITSSTTLRIEPGTRIFLGEKVNIDVFGTLIVAGTADDPVWVSALDPEQPWGGITLYRTTGTFTHTLFTHGGADTARKFGHSGSQPVVMLETAEANFDHVYLFDHPGKALGARSSKITFTNGLITRTDTGGEFSRSTVQIQNTHILDIPNGDGTFVDDDNDGLYFYEVHPDGTPSLVADTYIITGKDDAIDHNGAKLEIRRSWLEGFLHEGVAASNTNWVRVFNSVVQHCEQGIEAGYGAPEVMVDHSVVMHNDVGIRFGDSYDWGSNGRMTITNTILTDNQDNARNFDLQRQAPVDSAITFRHALTNDPDFDGCPTCLTGTPRFDADLYLLPDSPGKGAGENGADLGLIKE